jgi:hypothetical protein
LFYEIDEQLHAIPKHPERPTFGPVKWSPWGCSMPSKAGATGLLSLADPRLSGTVPAAPERTRLFRLFVTHQHWTQVFLAAPTVLGVIDTYGIELSHPIREGRSPRQIGRKGLSNHRWIVGGKLCLLLNQYGLVVG